MQTGQWVDVSEKIAVIYGAGQGCFDMMNEIQVQNVRFVIDSDQSKWGEEIELLNVTYRVQNPVILASLVPDEYYIIISSTRYMEKIKESISRYVGEREVIICNMHNIFYSYERIEDMFQCDPVMLRSVLLSNLSFTVNDMIADFKHISGMVIDDTLDRFIPSKGGESKLVFFFGNERKLWVFSFPGLHNDWERMGIDRDKQRNKEIRYYFKTRIDIDKKITVYESGTGILIQRYAGECIDFMSGEVKRAVLDKCRILHETDTIIDIRNDMVLRYYSGMIKKITKRYGTSLGGIKEIEQAMEKPLTMLKAIDYIPRVCHCDLFCSNIVCFDGELFFIDWEYMAMGDPLFDVCGFLFSIGIELCKTNHIPYDKAIQQTYELLQRDLSTYFKRKCSEEEYLHALLIMFVFECREVLGECLSTGEVNTEKLNILLRHIDCCLSC